MENYDPIVGVLRDRRIRSSELTTGMLRDAAFVPIYGIDAMLLAMQRDARETCDYCGNRIEKCGCGASSGKG